MNFVDHRQFDSPRRVSLRPRFSFSDFDIRDGRVFLKQTGNSARLDWRLLREVAGWLVFQAAIRVLAPWGGAQPPLTLRFVPAVPHDRYMVRAAARLAGIRLAGHTEAADAEFYFEDATTAVPPRATHARALNFGCGDISKSRVATVFERVFGYPLAVDPTRWHGDAVEKSEANGAHDGRIVACPRPVRPGCVYQRLIDTVGSEGLATDLRTHCIGGVAVAVWVKRRPAAARFLPPNATARWHSPDEIFSAPELALIGRFVRAMGADWCGLDILRDTDGRIYIVDVNKTDAGPIVALSFAAKLGSTRVLAKALRALVAPSQGAPPPAT